MENNDNMTPEEFENIRKGLGWTKRKLAQELGITVNKIYDYLNGKTKNIPKPIQKLMRIFNRRVEAAKILYGED